MTTARMHPAIRIAVVTALLSPMISGRLFGQCSQADKAALVAFDKAWGDASDSGDRARLAPFVSDNYMGVGITGTTDKQAMLVSAEHAAQSNKANPSPSIPADRFVITCTPSTATITHRFTVIDPTTKAVSYGRAIHFLEKSGTTWKAVSSMGHGVTDQAQLLYMEQDWNDASLRHDAEWTERNYASFASDISSRTGGIETKSEAVASARTEKIVYDALDLSEVAARVEGDVGVVTGVNRVRGKDAQGKAFDRRTRFTDTFIKRDGRWQVWATQGTLIQ
jgi:ketosteroid isomerase-like protein